jgi:hypothetical protein
MSPEKIRNPKPANDFFTRLVREVRLVWKLILDHRVRWFLKIIPILGIAALANPFGWRGLLVAVPLAIAGFILFVELCPEEVVNSNRSELLRVIPGTWRNPADEERKNEQK